MPCRLFSSIPGIFPLETSGTPTHPGIMTENVSAAAAAKSLQSYPTLCDPIGIRYIHIKIIPVIKNDKLRMFQITEHGNMFIIYVIKTRILDYMYHMIIIMFNVYKENTLERLVSNF